MTNIWHIERWRAIFNNHMRMSSVTFISSEGGRGLTKVSSWCHMREGVEFCVTPDMWMPPKRHHACYEEPLALKGAIQKLSYMYFQDFHPLPSLYSFVTHTQHSVSEWWVMSHRWARVSGGVMGHSRADPEWVMGSWVIRELPPPPQSVISYLNAP